MRRQYRWLKLVPFAAVLLFVAWLPLALAFPTPSLPWLTNLGVGSSGEAEQYYADIGAPATLAGWKSVYGFPGAGEVNAVYYNAADLGFGRNMHCRKNGPDVACYVANHGLGPGGPPQPAVDAAISGSEALPTVAMVYKASLDGSPNDVSFYVYDQAGNRIPQVALDSDGDKNVPHLCLPCHGGSYDDGTNSVSNAQFLPFDAPSFAYSQQPGYTLADQQEAFRLLNSMVLDTNPTALISELISGWYNAGGGVNVPNNTLDDSFVAAGYSGQSGVYNSVVKHYCRACHIAQLGTTLGSYTHLANARNAVFNGYYMPHAELTSHNFWSSDAPAYLANYESWSFRVSRTDDPLPNGCGPGDCSLREAIIAANGNVDKSIITFDVAGPFNLSRAGSGEDAASTGDLDITEDLIILGNAAETTIIEANGIDRVFHILNDAAVVMQKVTVQGGSTTDIGGGLFNDASTLDLIFSVVRNNQTTFSGGGVATTAGGTTIIDQSMLGPNNIAVGGPMAGWGGALYANGGGSVQTLLNSTVSHNTATYGGGLYNNASSTTNMRHATVRGNRSNSYGGGGLLTFAGATVQNSIISGNSGNADPEDCYNGGSLVSQGFNLVGEYGDSNGCPSGGTDMVVPGPSSEVIDPGLGSPGGLAPYHALVPGSQAIDAIGLGSNCTLPSYDQANLARPLDGDENSTPACDPGAVEAHAGLDVTTTTDTTADDGFCSLREAVTAIHTGSASGQTFGECVPGSDTIRLAVAGPYSLSAGEMAVTSQVIINGNGQTVDANTSSRFFTVSGRGHLFLYDITLREGSAPPGLSITARLAANASTVEDEAQQAALQTQAGANDGGAIVVMDDASLTLQDSTLTHNAAANNGGAIYSEGNSLLNILNSAIAENGAANYGGGIFNQDNAALNMLNSSVFSNSAILGAGLYKLDPGTTANIANSSILNNAASSWGGGVRNLDGDLNLSHVTIEGNSAVGEGGGIATNAGQVQIRNSIIADNSDTGSNNYPDIHGTVTSLGYNLIGNSGDQPYTPGSGDLVGSSGSPINAQFGGVLGNPGYRTLLAGSPAIDAVADGNCTFFSSGPNLLFASGLTAFTDQPGTPRPIDGNDDTLANCDMGAFEYSGVDAVFLPAVIKGQ